MAFNQSAVFIILALLGTITLSYQYTLRLRRGISDHLSSAELRDKQAVITAYNNEYNSEDGSFHYGYEQTNGISAHARGYLRDGSQVIEGFYSLYTKDGYPVRIQYIADENGFHAIGNAIPTPHPAIAKALEYQRSFPRQEEQNGYRK